MVVWSKDERPPPEPAETGPAMLDGLLQATGAALWWTEGKPGGEQEVLASDDAWGRLAKLAQSGEWCLLATDLPRVALWLLEHLPVSSRMVRLRPVVPTKSVSRLAVVVLPRGPGLPEILARLTAEATGDDPGARACAAQVQGLGAILQNMGLAFAVGELPLAEYGLLVVSTLHRLGVPLEEAKGMGEGMLAAAGASDEAKGQADYIVRRYCQRAELAEKDQAAKLAVVREAMCSRRAWVVLAMTAKEDARVTNYEVEALSARWHGAPPADMVIDRIMLECPEGHDGRCKVALFPRRYFSEQDLAAGLHLDQMPQLEVSVADPDGTDKDAILILCDRRQSPDRIAEWIRREIEGAGA